MPTLSHAPTLAARDQSPADSPAALLERVATQWHLQLRSALVALELTPAQFRLLVATAWLGARSAQVRQSDVSLHSNADPVMTSEVLRTLEARGLVTRGPHPNDRRAKVIAVTELGGALADRAIRLIDSIETKFFDGGMAEFGSLAKSLKKGGRGSSATKRA